MTEVAIWIIFGWIMWQMIGGWGILLIVGFILICSMFAGIRRRRNFKRSKGIL